MLTLSRCAACHETAFPPRDQCANCGATAPESVELDGRGRVVASTWVPAAFGLEGFGAEGFGVAWIDLAGGPRVQALVADQAPTPDAVGSVDVMVLAGVDVPVFEPEPT